MIQSLTGDLWGYKKMRPKLSWQIKTKILNEDVHHKGKSCNHGTEKVGKEKGDMNTLL